MEESYPPSAPHLTSSRGTKHGKDRTNETQGGHRDKVDRSRWPTKDPEAERLEPRDEGPEQASDQDRRSQVTSLAMTCDEVATAL